MPLSETHNPGLGSAFHPQQTFLFRPKADIKRVELTHPRIGINLVIMRHVLQLVKGSQQPGADYCLSTAVRLPDYLAR